MSRPKEVLPGVIKPLRDYRGWKKGQEKKTIEEKRQAVIRGSSARSGARKGPRGWSSSTASRGRP